MLLKIVVILMMLAILASLGSAAVFLFRRGNQHGHGFARALTWRIGLSIALFVMLMAGFYFGFITPGGTTP